MREPFKRASTMVIATNQPPSQEKARYRIDAKYQGAAA